MKQTSSVVRQDISIADGRTLDIRFYRAAYEDVSDVEDAELEERFRRGSLPAGQPVNPTEFLQKKLADGSLPSDFDPIGYRIHNPALWGSGRSDWEIALHYLKAGHTTTSGWERPFDPNFYRELYLPHGSTTDADWLRAHRRSHPNAYGSIEEALVRNGWSNAKWIVTFNSHLYTVINTLFDQLRNPIQALVHFIETGWRELLATSVDTEFDPLYFADLMGRSLSLPAEELYRFWIERGGATAAPGNEKEHLRALQINLRRYPEGFDWRVYLAERPEASAAARDAGHAPSRWDALIHLFDHGVLSAGPPLPVIAESLPALLLSAGDRFASLGRERDADKVYERGLLCLDPPADLLQHAADNALRQGRSAYALILYRRIRAMSAAGFWTWSNGGKAALAAGNREEAAEWLLAGLAQHPRSAHLYDILLEVQHARFDQAVARHIGMLRAGQAESDIASTLDAILDTFLAAHRVSFGDPTPLRRLSDNRPLQVVVLANEDLPQCTFYRVDLKLEQFRAAGTAQIKIFERAQAEDFRSAAATADVALFYRLASDVETLRSIAVCRAIGIPTVYEVDDLIFDPTAFPDPLEIYDNAITEEEHFGLRAGVALVRHAAASCDVGIASTEHLAARMRKLVRSGVSLVHRNGLSDSLAALAQASVPRAPPSGDATVTLFYGSGTRAHGADFRELIVPGLTRLMAEHRDVRLIVCGHVDAAALSTRFPGRVLHVPPLADREAYLAQFQTVDINLAVLRDSAFNDCKSEIKWLEAAAFCVPSIVSNVGGYRETLRPNTEVIRVPASPAAWYNALRALILDPAQRAAIGAAARDRALACYQPAALGRSLIDKLKLLKTSADLPAPPRKRRGSSGTQDIRLAPAQARRPRLLLANVFFPPQAIGGATRIVRDQAEELLNSYAERYEIGILCGNDEQQSPYRTEAYTWRGAPVWSVSSPHREHMDWLPFDPLMADPVDAVLDRFQPDLVHAHCIQRLTATALERVSTRGIPYLVTAHDAWWISDHQFLMDGTDRLTMPGDLEEFESDGNPHTRAASGSRRLRLRGVLDKAAAVMAVSEEFAEIYRRAGIGKAMAVPNGLPRLPPIDPAPRVPGRVRLALLGGIMAHKGYFLLRQALVRGGFDNLDLLLVDHSMKPGETRQETWGRTPVNFIGRVPQHQVGKLYGSFDVLCAPSLWPESYGLVAREALHYGKWIIASARGAIGQDVVPGQNGWVVDVSHVRPLIGVLEEIDANPKKYTSCPKLRAVPRTVAQQVSDVVGRYDGILTSGKSKEMAVLAPSILRDGKRRISG